MKGALTLAAVFAVAMVALAPAEAPVGVAPALSRGAKGLARGLLDVAEIPDPSTDRYTVVRKGRRRVDLPLGAQLALTPIALVTKNRSALQWRLNEALAAICVLAIALRLRRRLLDGGSSPTVAWLGGLVAALATGLLGAARVFDGTALAAWLAFVSFDLALPCADRRGRGPGGLATARRSRPLALGFALGGLVLVEPAWILAALSLAFAATRRAGGVLAPRMYAPLGVGVTIAAAHALAVGGSFGEGALADGVVGLTLSTGKGILFFTPLFLTLPWVFYQKLDDRRLLVAFLVAGVLGVGISADWHGDPAYGPVRIAPLIAPGLAFIWPALMRSGVRARSVATLLAAAGFSVQLLGALLPPTAFPTLVTHLRIGTNASGWFTEPQSEIHFIPQFSPITGHLWMLRVHTLRPPAKSVPERDPWHFLLPHAPRFDSEVTRVPIDLWWYPRPHG